MPILLSVFLIGCGVFALTLTVTAIVVACQDLERLWTGGRFPSGAQVPAGQPGLRA